MMLNTRNQIPGLAMLFSDLTTNVWSDSLKEKEMPGLIHEALGIISLLQSQPFICPVTLDDPLFVLEYQAENCGFYNHDTVDHINCCNLVSLIIGKWFPHSSNSFLIYFAK